MNLKNSVDNDFLQLKIPDAVVLWRKTQLLVFLPCSAKIGSSGKFPKGLNLDKNSTILLLHLLQLLSN